LIKNDLSPSALVEAIEESQRLYFKKLSENLPQAFQEEDSRGISLTWFITGIKFPMFNGVCRAQISKDKIDETIERVLEPFKFGKIPMFWWIGPSTDPPGLDKILANHGLKQSGQDYGMALDLSKLEENIRKPNGFEIKKVQSTYQLIEWLDAAGPVLGLMPESLGETLKLFDHGFGDNKDLVHYMGMLDGKIVATLSIFYGGGVAGIYTLATIPEARGKGIGRMLTQSSLIDSRDNGYSIGVLQSTKIGYNLFLSLGFKEYCRFDVMYANFSK